MHRLAARSKFVAFVAVAGLAMLGCSSTRERPTNDTASATRSDATSSTVPVNVASVRPTATVTTVAVATTDLADPTSARPFEVVVPASYSAAVPAPLLIVLHGYTGSGAVIRSYFGLDAAAQAKGVIVVYPDGSKTIGGTSFWNATNACCGFGATDDDSGYLMAVVDKVRRDYRVDPKRVYFAGHSNGGFMSYRMACDHADRVAAILSLAGATFADTTACKPTEPVSVVQVHGTNDERISYVGGQIGGTDYPSAEVTAGTWAGYDQCGSLRADHKTVDLESAIQGPETSVRAATGCPAGISVELWTIAGGVHGPTLSPTFATSVIDFLLAHPKP